MGSKIQKIMSLLIVFIFLFTNNLGFVVFAKNEKSISTIDKLKPKVENQDDNEKKLDKKEEETDQKKSKNEKVKFKNILNLIDEKDKGKKFKKINLLQKGIKKNGKIKLYVKSDDELGMLKNFFPETINIEKIEKGLYKFTVDGDSSLYKEINKALDNNNFPTLIGDKYEILQPELLEIEELDGLNGEEIDKMWGMEYLNVIENLQDDSSILPKIKVGVIDTGIYSDHADLNNNINQQLGYDFLNDSNIQSDDNGHGTHIAGIIGGIINNKGIFGVNPNVEIVSLKVADENGYASSYDVIEAINYAKLNGIQVLNISMGGSGTPATSQLCNSISQAKIDGVIIVVSAGNNNTDISGVIPAGCSASIVVGSIGLDGNKSSFSNYGNNVYGAPGEGIYSSWNDGGYKYKDGTSQATAFVSGKISYLLSKGHNLDEIINNELPTLFSGIVVQSDSGYGEEIIGDIDSQIGSGNVNSLSGFEKLDISNIIIGDNIDIYNSSKQQIGDINANSIINGLVAKWTFDQCNANDSVGNTNGVAYGSVTCMTGAVGNSLKFGGYGNIGYIEIPNSSSISMMNNFTYNFWYNLSTFEGMNGVQAFFAKQGDRSGLNMFTTGKKIYAQSGIRGGNRPWIGSNDETNLNNWNMATVVYSGGNINLYINGNYNSGYQNYALNPAMQNSKLRLGISESGYWYPLNGRIDEFSIYNRPLTSSEVSQLYYNIAGYPYTIPNNSTYYSILRNQGYFTNSNLIYKPGDFNTEVSENNKKCKIGDPYRHKLEITNSGDPVNLSNGEFIYNNTLMSIPGNRLNYSLDVNYRNQTYYNGPLGINWDHNYNLFLTGDETGTLTYYNGKLGMFRFPLEGDDYVYNPGLKAQLFTGTNDEFILKFDSGDYYSFYTGNNRIEFIKDRYGNQISFEYNTGNLLSKVIDTNQNEILYNYFDHNRLKEVIDPNGRKVEFKYFESNVSTGMIYDLQQIKINNGTGFTKNIDFTYTLGDEINGHNLIDLYDSKGQKYVTNVFSGDRVTSQVFGSGTLNYSYVLSGSSVVKNTVTNKNGIVTEYLYDDYGNNIQMKTFDKEGGGSTVYQFEYDTFGRIIKETKPRGNGIKYLYDSKGNIIEKREKTDINSIDDDLLDIVVKTEYDEEFDKPIEIIDSQGTIVNFDLDNDGNVISKTINDVSDYSGNVVDIVNVFEYNNLGLLSKSIDPEGKETVYEYSEGQLISIINGTGGNYISGSFVYDIYGNMISSIDGKGFTKNLIYNEFNQLIEEISPEGISKKYYYDKNNNIIKQEVILGNGSIPSQDFYFDLLDNVTGTLIKINNTSNVLTKYIYDSNGNVVESQVGNGAIIRYSYNEFDRVKRQRVIVNTSDSSQDVLTQYFYDRNGNLIKVIDPLNNENLFEYDMFDRLVKTIDAKGNYSMNEYNKLGKIIQISKYNSNDQLITKNGLEYDELGNVIKKIDYKLEDSSQVITKYKYNKNSQIIESIDAMNHISTIEYDIFGREFRVVDNQGNILENTYDKNNNIVQKMIIPAIGEQGSSIILYEYDDDNRLIKQTNQDGTFKIYDYNNLNQIIKTIDENGNIINYQYNYIGKLTQENKILINEGVNIEVITNYNYDERGNLLSIVDSNGNSTSYEYDKLNRVTRYSPVGAPGSYNYTYDKNNNLLSTNDNNQVQTTNTYNELNRLVKKEIATLDRNTRQYDISTEEYLYDDLGRLLSGATFDNDIKSSEVVFEYDSLNRILNEKQGLSLENEIQYEYDILGNKTKVKDNKGGSTQYLYDSIGRLSEIKYNKNEGVQPRETVKVYNYTGLNLDNFVYGNGIQTKYNYDNLNRMSGIQTIFSGNSLLQDQVFYYDNVGNITGTNEMSYLYDSINRLIISSNNSFNSYDGISEYTNTYQMDNVGNRQFTNIMGTGLNYSSRRIPNMYNLVVDQNGEGKYYDYDNNGNLAYYMNTNLKYDYKNRLIGKRLRDHLNNSRLDKIKFKYDILGRRIEKIVNDGVNSYKIEYVYSNQNIIREVRTQDGIEYDKNYINGLGIDDLLAYDQEETTLPTLEQRELKFYKERVVPYSLEFTNYGRGSMLDRTNVLQQGMGVKTTNRYYFHKNQLGSIIGLSNGSGDIVIEYGYDDYGKVFVKAGQGEYISIENYEGNDYSNVRLYTSREYDKELGRYYYRARMYSPELGRFTSLALQGMQGKTQSDQKMISICLPMSETIQSIE